MTKMKRWIEKANKKRMCRMRLARMRVTIKGKFTRWPAGMVVYARWSRGSTYSVERVNLIRRGIVRCAMPLENACVGIPRSALEFLGPIQDMEDRLYP